MQHKDEIAGWTISVVLHLLLFILFLFIGLKHIEPIPEQGIMIDFGNSEEGMNFSEQEQVLNSSAPNQPQAQASEEEEVLTQNEEETVAISSTQNKKRKEKEIKQEEIKKEEKIKEELKNLLQAWQSNQSSASSNEGITDHAGNQGKIDGDPNSNQYSSGGNGGGNISYSLTGRSIRSYPKIEDTSQEQGIVVVEIWVNPQGEVIKAEPGYRGSTTTSPLLYKKAKEAALKTKFSVKPDAPEEQRGTITFRFILN